MPTYQTIQTLVTTSLTTVFTATAVATQIYDLFVKNLDQSSDIRLTIHLVKSGESVSNTNKFINDLILKDDNKPLFQRPVLAAGDTIQLSADTTDQLVVFITLLELE